MTGAVSLGLSSMVIVITEKPTIKTQRVTEAFVQGSIQTTSVVESSSVVSKQLFPRSWFNSPSPCSAGECLAAKGRGYLPLLVHRRHRSCWVQTVKYYCSGILMSVKAPATWLPSSLPHDSQNRHMLWHWAAAHLLLFLCAISCKCWTDVKFVAFPPCPDSFLPLSTKVVISCCPAACHGCF